MIFFACVRIGNMYQNLINKSKNTTRMNSKLIFQEKLPTENPVNVAEPNRQGRYWLIFAKITAYDL